MTLAGSLSLRLLLALITMASGLNIPLEGMSVMTQVLASSYLCCAEI